MANLPLLNPGQSRLKRNSQINTKYVTSHAAGENSIKISKHTLWGTEAPKLSV